MKRSKHALSNTCLTSFDMGELVPVQHIETLPGDSMQLSTSLLVRCAPMLAPPMHPVAVRVHHWFVPYRLIWNDWEDFITGGPDGNSSPQYPLKAAGNVTAGSLYNYLGLPIGNFPTVDVSALPFRAYSLIWNEYYRDQDLQSEVTVDKTSTAFDNTNNQLLRVCWPKDYFTVSRPWEQKGPAVTVPIGTSAPVSFEEIGATPGARTIERNAGTAGAGLSVLEAGTAAADIRGVADLSSATGITVNQLRESLAIQRFEEARAIGGSRYTEYLRGLGVLSSDARLQRPEYLGGGVQNIQFSEVLQTAQDETNPVGTLRGHGITAMRSNRCRRFFEEHGVVMTLVSVLPKPIYMNGIERSWNRRTKFDFWQKELENLGQQPIANKEIYGGAASPEGTFGYVDRYDEYRRSWSRVTGEFATSALDYWHFARKFASEPALNSTFVSAVPPERAFAAPDTDVLYVQCHNSVKARRLVSARAVPRTF